MGLYPWTRKCCFKEVNVTSGMVRLEVLVGVLTGHDMSALPPIRDLPF